MRKKICPVCDRELTAAGYCKLCRRLVLRPLVREIDYYLNETPPDEGAFTNQKTPEGGRGPDPSGKMALNDKLARLREKAVRKAERLEEGGRKSQGENKQAAGKTGRKRRSSGENGDVRGEKTAAGSGQGPNRMFGNIGLDGGQRAAPAKPRRENSEKTKGAIAAGVIILCIVLLNVFPLIANLFYGKVQDTFVRMEPEPGWEDGASFFGDSGAVPDGGGTGPGYGEVISTQGVIFPEDEEGAAEEAAGIATEYLDEMQVRAAGVRCPGMEHFRCTGETLERELGTLLDQKGLIYGIAESTSNYRLESGGGVYEFYDYYRDYTVWGENGDPAVLVSVNSDTATDEVHSVSVNAYSPDDNGLAAELMAWIADLAAGSEGTVTPQELLSAVYAESYVERGGYNYVIYGYDYEGAAMVMDPCENWDETGDIYQEEALSKTAGGNARSGENGRP